MTQICGFLSIIIATLSMIEKWNRKAEFPGWELVTIMWIIIANTQ